jgi:hypothetical protein
MELAASLIVLDAHDRVSPIGLSAGTVEVDWRASAVAWLKYDCSRAAEPMAAALQSNSAVPATETRFSDRTRMHSKTCTMRRQCKGA